MRYQAYIMISLISKHENTGSRIKSTTVKNTGRLVSRIHYSQQEDHRMVVGINITLWTNHCGRLRKSLFESSRSRPTAAFLVEAYTDIVKCSRQSFGDFPRHLIDVYKRHP